MDKILIWWENTFGGNSAIWNLDYGKLIIIGILVYHVWFQHQESLHENIIIWCNFIYYAIEF